MNFRLVILSAAICASSFSSAAASGLAWKNTSLDLDCAPGDEKLVAAFPFRNTAEGPVEIVSVTSSCGCTVPELAQKVFAPDEEGVLRAVFTIGDRTGPQRKILRVVTRAAGADAEETTTVLTLRTDIPETGSVRPRLLLWRRQNADEERKVLVTALPGYSWRIALPEEGVPFVFGEPEQEQDEGGGELLPVRPSGDLRPLKASVGIEFLDPDGKVVGEEKLFLMIR